jgi:hypothetical protein
MSTDFKPQDDSGNFAGTTWRGRLSLLLSVIVVSLMLVITALSFEFLAEELAKVYVVPILVAEVFALFGLSIVVAKYRSEELY